MKISDFINRRAVTIDLKSDGKKEDILRELVELVIKAGDVKSRDKESLVKTLIEREVLGSTGIGQSVGIPHGKSAAVKSLTGAVAISKNGVNFESLDGEPVHILFLLLAPQDSAGPHLKALARISRLLKDKYFRDILINAKNEKELMNIMVKEDQKRH